MTNPEHLKMLSQGVDTFNKWREENPDRKVDLKGANLIDANLIRANLSDANLNGANLSKADLSNAILVGTNFTEADFTDSRIYGFSAWYLVLNKTTQTGLISLR
jgi:uncharacterized protein YjbI with pentapeptide repeats